MLWHMLNLVDLLFVSSHTHTPEIKIDTLPENQPLKINGWKMKFPFGKAKLSGRVRYLTAEDVSGLVSTRVSQKKHGMTGVNWGGLLLRSSQQVWGHWGARWGRFFKRSLMGPFGWRIFCLRRIDWHTYMWYIVYNIFYIWYNYIYIL